jgi:hypothetical protein
MALADAEVADAWRSPAEEVREDARLQAARASGEGRARPGSTTSSTTKRADGPAANERGESLTNQRGESPIKEQ